MFTANHYNTKKLLSIVMINLVGIWLAFGLTAIPISSQSLFILENCLDIIGIILGFIVFVITWYGAGQNSDARTTVIGLVLFASSILDFTNILSYLGSPLDSMITSHLWLTYGFFARMIFSVGILYAISLTRKGIPSSLSYRSLLYITISFISALILNLTYNHSNWFLVKDDQLETVAMFAQYLYCLLSCLSLYLVRRQNHTDKTSIYLQFSLMFAILTDLSFALSGSNPFALNLSGLFFKILSYHFILRAMFFVVIEAPFEASLQMHKELSRLVETNEALFKEHEENYTLLEDILAKLGVIMSSQLNLKDTLTAIADMIADVMQMPQSLIALKNHSPCYLQVVSTYGMNTPPLTMPLNNSLAGKVLEEKTSYSISDLTQHPELYRPKLIFSEIKSMISAPLLNDHEVIGVIEIYSNKKNAFDDKSVQLITALGHHAGAAIFSAKLYEETKMMLNEEKHLLQMAQIAASTIDSKTILEESLKHTANALQADVALGFIENENKEYELLASFELDIIAHYSLSLSNCQELNTLMQKGKPMYVPADILPFKQQLCLNYKINKCLLMPLTSGQKLLGFLLLGWIKPSDERIASLDFPALLAQQIALGIEKASLYNQVKSMALSDGLTGLANRRSYDTFLQTEIQRSLLHQKPLSLIMLDLDKFKLFNDTYGHLTGDKLLKKIGRILKSGVRKADIPARYGGEEFSIILPECSQTTAIELAEALRKTIETTAFCDQCDVLTAHITASLGIVTYDPTLSSSQPLPGELIAAADKALYTAKQTGRNRVVTETL